jgi:phosphopantothenoylcysteine decarboxylase/phosphopantothenate--cysteine ligase
LSGKRILLVVTGGIAAYKSALLVRLLTCAGASVRVVMSRAAAEFVTPLTFETLSGNPVHTDLFARRGRPSVQHVELSEWADRVVVAPATADILAKAALGVADDMASTVLLAARAPVLFAPAMNDEMWKAPAVGRNIERLRADGRIVLRAASGLLACGAVGPGRMLEPEEIVCRIEESFAPGDLAGATVLVTAGRTEEAIDPVRYLTNRSSGRMGFAVAREARARGARVVLVHGAVDGPGPAADETVRVTDAAGMKRAVAKAFGACDVCVMAAAVSDFTPARPLDSKIKRGASGLSLDLRPTEDILRSLSKRKGRRIVVGFALETENGEANARRKARAKGCDYMVLNEPGPDTGFAAPTNRIVVFKGTKKLFATPVVSKEEAARRIVDALAGDRRLGNRGR